MLLYGCIHNDKLPSVKRGDNKQRLFYKNIIYQLMKKINLQEFSLNGQNYFKLINNLTFF